MLKMETLKFISELMLYLVVFTLAYVIIIVFDRIKKIGSRRKRWKKGKSYEHEVW